MGAAMKAAVRPTAIALPIVMAAVYAGRSSFAPARPVGFRTVFGQPQKRWKQRMAEAAQYQATISGDANS